MSNLFNQIKNFSENHQKTISSYPCECGAIKEFFERLCPKCLYMEQEALREHLKEEKKPCI